MPEFRLAIVIVNYQTPDLVTDCLTTLSQAIDPAEDRVIVVDSASRDHSLAQIEEMSVENGWDGWLQLQKLPVNRGFSVGNNVGITAVDAAAYWLTNSDTLIQRDARHQLLQALDTHPRAGIISPRLEWSDGTPQISCFRDESPLSELLSAARTGPLTNLLKQFEVPLPVADLPFQPDWTSFASVLLRRKMIDQIGPLDEGYFMYFEDVDYCRRAREAGWEILHWPQAHVVHLRGGTSPVKAATAARERRPTYYYAARTRYLAKHYGQLGLVGANMLWELGRTIALAREVVGQKEPHVCRYEWRDIWTNWRDPLRAPEGHLLPTPGAA